MPENHWLRPAAGPELAVVMPYFSMLPRLERPPAVYLGGRSPGKPAYVMGLLPEGRFSYPGRSYAFEFLLLDDMPPVECEAAAENVAALVHDLGADCLVTAYLPEDGAEAASLQAMGFEIAVRHRELYIAREAVTARMAAAKRHVERRQGRGVEIRSVTPEWGEGLRGLLARDLGVLPDGYHVLTDGLDGGGDYSLSRVAVRDDTCHGALIVGRRGGDLDVEAIVVREEDRGSTVAGLLILHVLASVASMEVNGASFRIAADNLPSLRLAEGLGAVHRRDWLRLARRGEAAHA